MISITNLELGNAVAASTELLQAHHIKGQRYMNLMFSSPVGNPEAAMLLVDAMRQCQADGMYINGMVLGMSYGPAVFALQACDRRVMSKYAQLMLPQYQTVVEPTKKAGFGPADPVDEEEIVMMERIKFMQQLMKALLPAALHEYHFPDRWPKQPMPRFWTADEALAAGLIDEIVPA